MGPKVTVLHETNDESYQEWFYYCDGSDLLVLVINNGDKFDDNRDDYC